LFAHLDRTSRCSHWLSTMGRAIQSKAWRHLCGPRRDLQRDIGKIAVKVKTGRKEATNKTPHAECRGVRALPYGPSSLEQVERRRVLQGDRILSAGSRERPQLRSRLHRVGGAKKGSTRRSNTFSRQSRKTPVTLSPTPGWPIPTCSWDGTAI